MTLELKNCPFCGREAILESWEKVSAEPRHWVHCPGCLVQGPGYTKRELAVKAWNRRVKDESASVKPVGTDKKKIQK